MSTDSPLLHPKTEGMGFVAEDAIKTHNFKVNHNIPPEVFTVDIPGNATIHVEELGRKLHKEAFRHWNEDIHLKGIKLIKDR